MKNMIDFETLGYFVYMDELEQEEAYKNRSAENEQLQDGEQASQEEESSS